jgi:hypothetical protein
MLTTAAVADVAADLAFDIAVDVFGYQENGPSDEATGFVTGLQDAFEAAVTVVHGVTPQAPASPAMTKMLEDMHANIRFRLGLS